MRNFKLTLFLFVVLGSMLYAQNPIVQTNYTADAASLVYNNRFYIYAGRDQASPTGRFDKWESVSTLIAVWKANREAFPVFENWMFTYETGNRW